MIQVRIAGLSLDPRNNQPVLILKPVEGDLTDHLLPIWIGHPEASAILIGLESAETPRPMTHDLLYSVIAGLDAMVRRVEVTRVDEGTFYAAVVLRAEEKTVAIDARPSDSIALAVRTGAPIYVAEEVLTEASVPESMIERASESGDESNEEAQVEQFREFLEQVDPADFQE